MRKVRDGAVVTAAACVAALAPVFFGGVARSAESQSDSPLGASMRTIAVGTRYYHDEALFGPGNRADGAAQSILRITWKDRPDAWATAEAHAVGSAEFSPASASAALGDTGASAGAAAYRALQEEESWGDADFSSRVRVDRANLKFAASFLDLTVGRQAVTFGQAYFWSPLDVFSPFDPREFDRDYKAGVDAVRLDVPLGAMAGINVVAAGGRTAGRGGDRDFFTDWNGSALLGRLFAGAGGWDLAAQGGKVYGGRQYGAGCSGEFAGMEVRGEGAWFQSASDARLASAPDTRELESCLVAVAGVGRRLASGIRLESEYLFNGAGLPDDLAAAAERVAAGRALHLGRHLAGAMLSWEITPLWRSSVAVLWSFSDHSAAVQPGLNYSVSDEAELLLGAIANTGRRPAESEDGPVPRSEFGSRPDLCYLEYKVYF